MTLSTCVRIFCSIASVVVVVRRILRWMQRATGHRATIECTHVLDERLHSAVPHATRMQTQSAVPRRRVGVKRILHRAADSNVFRYR